MQEASLLPQMNGHPIDQGITMVQMIVVDGLTFVQDKQKSDFLSH